MGTGIRSHWEREREIEVERERERECVSGKERKRRYEKKNTT